MRRSIRSWLSLAGLPLLAWLALCALLYAQQRQLIYLPQHTRVDPAATDFSLPREAGIELRGWRAGDGADALLYFGGNAEPLQYMRDAAPRLFPRHAVHLLAYRGYGASDGEPGEAALVADALALYDHVRATQPTARIDVIGRSLGSGIAAQLAARRPVDRLVLVTPFDSLAAVAGHHYPWLPVRWLLHDRYESARHLAGYSRPLLVIRAGRDAVVPPRHTDALLAVLPASTRVVDLPAAGHDLPLDDPVVAAEMAAFLGD